MLKRLLILALLTIILAACQAAPPPTRPPEYVNDIVRNATILTKETAYIVRLGFDRSSMDLMKDSAKSFNMTGVVGESTYNSWQVGQVFYSGMSTALEWAEWTVSLEEKFTIVKYYWHDQNGKKTEITADEYEQAMDRLTVEDDYFTVNRHGITTTYVLDKSYAQISCSTIVPAELFFLELDINNEVRLDTGEDYLVLELSEKEYAVASIGQSWSSDLSSLVGDQIGILARSLQGVVIKKWTDHDQEFNICEYNGRKLILPAD